MNLIPLSFSVVCDMRRKFDLSRRIKSAKRKEKERRKAKGDRALANHPPPPHTLSHTLTHPIRLTIKNRFMVI